MKHAIHISYITRLVSPLNMLDMSVTLLVLKLFKSKVIVKHVTHVGNLAGIKIIT
ncbi:MAG: Hypothetical protein AJITA_00851 [Acetilactobacillus jinshanensis]